MYSLLSNLIYYQIYRTQIHQIVVIISNVSCRVVVAISVNERLLSNLKVRGVEYEVVL